MKKLFLIFTVLFLVKSALFCQKAPSAYEPEIVAAFAQDLLDNGFLEEAVSEYKRSLFLGKQKNKSLDFTESAVFNLCSIYNQLNDKDGIIWLKENFKDSVSKDVQEKIDFVDFRFLFLERDTDTFSNKFCTMGTVLPLYSKQTNDLVLISYDVLNNKISDANIKASFVVQELEVYKDFVTLSSDYKLKNKGLATMLSIFIPGSGKWYTGSFASFMSSFFSIASFTSACVYTGIQSEWKNWQPYVYGSIAAILYVTDIYGSYKSAQRYNQAKYRKLCESLDLVYEELY